VVKVWDVQGDGDDARHACLRRVQGKRVVEIEERDGSVIFAVRVQPRASKDEIVGEMDGALKVRLQAPALEDRANEALCEHLARLLKTPKGAVRILSGERSRRKRVEIRGVTKRQVLELMEREA
jgi:uncharacterized protein (TIGR00251 family)